MCAKYCQSHGWAFERCLVKNKRFRLPSAVPAVTSEKLVHLPLLQSFHQAHHNLWCKNIMQHTCGNNSFHNVFNINHVYGVAGADIFLLVH